MARAIPFSHAMSDLWLIDETAIETRLARLVAGRLALLQHYPKIGWAARGPRPGDIFAVRVGQKSPATGGRFLDLGASGEGFLRDGAALPEGTMAVATVIQAPFAEKSARLVLGAGDMAGVESEAIKARAAAASQPLRLSAAPDAVQTLIARARANDRIHIASAALLRVSKALAAARAPDLAAAIEPAGPDLFEREGVEAAIEQAIEATLPLRGGGRLVIEMTQALTAVDVDTAGARDAGAVNVAAAALLPFEIAVRELAGTILIDFAKVRDRSALERLGRTLSDGAAALGLEIEIGQGRRGLVDIRRARTEAPLAARLTKSGITHLAVSPVLSFEAQTARIARALAKARPASRREIHVPPTLAAWLEEDGREFRAAILSTATGAHLLGTPELEPDRFELLP